jgi:chromosome segregation ATPase
MAGRHERPPHLRQLAPIAAAVLLAALALVVSPVGGDRWLRALAAVAVLVVALPGMAALDGLLRVSDRAAEQATARAEEAARLRLQVAELRRDHDNAWESTGQALQQLQRDVSATRAFARGGRDELVTAVERIGVLERGLSSLRGEVGEVAARLDAAAEQAGAARVELATMRAEVAGTRSEVVATSQAVTASRTDAAQVARTAAALHDQLATLRTELAALRAELDVHAEGVEATTVRMTLPLVRAALRRDPLEPATLVRSERARRTGA